VGVSARTINQVNSRQKPLWGKTDRGIMFPLVKDLKHRTIFRRTMLEGIVLRLVSGFLKLVFYDYYTYHCAVGPFSN
jgi:hypothetical protein